jgi:hypothetical protein
MQHPLRDRALHGPGHWWPAPAMVMSSTATRRHFATEVVSGQPPIWVAESGPIPAKVVVWQGGC